jgi:mRNA degradation ribonuclease J1/J2
MRSLKARSKGFHRYQFTVTFETDEGAVLTKVSSSNLHQLEQVIDKAVELGIQVALEDTYRHTLLFVSVFVLLTANSRSRR